MNTITNEAKAEAIRILSGEETDWYPAASHALGMEYPHLSGFPIFREIPRLVLDHLEDEPYCAVSDDGEMQDGEMPGAEDERCITIGFDWRDPAQWDWQSYDNSFHGGAYRFSDWAVCQFWAPRDCTEIPDILVSVCEELFDQMEKRIEYNLEFAVA